MRQERGARPAATAIFQLTHSRGVRPAKKFTVDDFSHISTHALTWSATLRCFAPLPAYLISTHALTWSATIWYMSRRVISGISTHALTWSATFKYRKENENDVEFQLTHSRGVRPFARRRSI